MKMEHNSDTCIFIIFIYYTYMKTLRRSHFYMKLHICIVQEMLYYSVLWWMNEKEKKLKAIFFYHFKINVKCESLCI